MTSLAVTLLGLVATHLGGARSGVADLVVSTLLAVAVAHPPSRELVVGLAAVVAGVAGGHALYRLQAQRRMMDTDPEAAPTEHGGMLRRPRGREWSVDLVDLERRLGGG